MEKERPHLLIADTRGRIYDVPYLEAVGMKGGEFFRLSKEHLIPLPYGSELFVLPHRMPVGYDAQAGEFITSHTNPLKKKEKCFSVAAFICPGYTTTFNSAYIEVGKAGVLPLFSYAAAAFYKGKFYAACIKIDRERRQDLRYMKESLVKKNAKRIKKLFPKNRLISHLKNCALRYGCPAAKNFFLSRYEAPLPTSPYCNAQCAGCISYQPKKKCPVTQPRIKFVPYPAEISEVARYHISKVKDPVVSFGQGCEGEPLLAGYVIEKAVKLIRRSTHKGIINLNTNASRPVIISRLFDAGLDSIRVSLNSVRAAYYLRYYKPKNYSFKDVLSSIRIAKQKRGFVSVNYLTLPGFTDTKQEFEAFKKFIGKYDIDMVQWRNLNFDPLRYFKDLKLKPSPSKMLGIKYIIKSLRKSFPKLMMGYFNPSKGRMKRQGPERA